MDTRTIENLIKTGIPDAQVSVEDPRGDGQHYMAVVESSQFQGLSRIQQHQLVFAALGNAIREDIHALQLTCVARKPR